MDVPSFFLHLPSFSFPFDKLPCNLPEMRTAFSRCLFVVMSLLRIIQCYCDINNTLFTDKQIRSSLGLSSLGLS